MKTVAMKLVTIISEPILTEKIFKELKRLGSTGATVSEVRGEGTRQLHSSEVPGDHTKIECVVPEKVAETIMEHLSNKYFPNYSVIAYLTDVSVVRPDKYTKK